VENEVVADEAEYLLPPTIPDYVENEVVADELEYPLLLYLTMWRMR